MKFSTAGKHQFPLLATLTVALLFAALATWCYIRWQSGSPTKPPFFALGMPSQPYNVLFMGTDLPYRHFGKNQSPDVSSFTGRADTIMLIHIDPLQQTIAGIHIPRDTIVHIPGYGYQKVNAANAIGGAPLARQTVSGLLGVPIDHYVVLNVHGLVDVVNELGGITVEVPKRMAYMDWTAKLKIDLEPGMHTLTGNQAMGFVRFRHDQLGDIGRIQRQQIFMRAFTNKLCSPASWSHLPKLLAIMNENVLTDMSQLDLLQAFNVARAAHRNVHFAMLPGRFGSSGSWVPDHAASENVVARICGLPTLPDDKHDLTVCVQNVSSFPDLEDKISAALRRSGYQVIELPNSGYVPSPKHKTRIIAQQANTDDAEMVKSDLGNCGEIVNASIGDIYSKITVLVDNDLEPVFGQLEADRQ